MSDDVRVIYFAPDGIAYRRTLRKDQYSINSSGQIILPEKHYSAGYCARMDLSWDSCPDYDYPQKSSCSLRLRSCFRRLLNKFKF